MPRSLPHLRCIAKWSCIAIAVITPMVAAVSLFVGVSRTDDRAGPRLRSITIANGAVTIRRSFRDMIGLGSRSPRWTVWWPRPRERRMTWWPRRSRWGVAQSHGPPFNLGSGDSITLPLWMPFAAFALPSVWLLWPHLRLTRHGHCPRCHYDLRGLPPNSPCPECGSLHQPKAV
jgi:hypothetical protein